MRGARALCGSAGVIVWILFSLVVEAGLLLWWLLT